MYEKLTEKAQKVFKHARQEAQRMGHQYIGTEHLLLGLVREGTGVAAKVLQPLGVDPKRVRFEVERIVKSDTEVVSTGRDFTLAAGARKAFEHAFEESKRLGQKHIGTEHLLLGLLKEEEGIAAQVLLNLGVELDEVRKRVKELTGAAPEPEPVPPPPRRETATYELTVEDHFAAAHNLREYEGECERLHGHNWKVEVRLGADELDELGMVVDFRVVKAALGDILGRLDHEYLNETAPFDTLNPTTENLCRHVAEQLGGRLPSYVRVRRVTCWESDRCSASYLPEGG